MRNFVFIPLILWCLAACRVAERDGSSEVLATFRGGEIRLSELDTHILALPAGRRIPPATRAPEVWLKQELDKVFQKKLLVTEEELLFLRTDAAFQQQLRLELRRLLTAAYLQRHMPDTEVSEEELRTYFAAQRERLIREEKRALLNFFLSFPENATTGQKRAVRERAQEILSRIRAGASFEEMARKHSQSSTAKQSGLIGLIGRGDLREEMAEVVFSLRAGEVSDVVESRAGCQFFYVKEVVGGSTPEVAEIRQQLETRLENEKGQKWIEAHLSQVMDQLGVELPAWVESGPPDGLSAQSVVFSLGTEQIMLGEVLRHAGPSQRFGQVLRLLVSGLVFSRQQRNEDPGQTREIERRTTVDLAFQRLRELSLTEALGKIPLQELKAFYQENKKRFMSQPRLEMTVYQWPIGNGDPLDVLKRPRAFARLLRLDKTGGASDWPGLKKNRIPLVGLRELALRDVYLTGQLPAKLEEGLVVGPFRQGDQLKVVRIDSYLPPTNQPFVEAKPLVLREYASRERLRLEREWLKRLKRDSQYEINARNISGYGRNLLKRILEREPSS